MDDPIEPVLSDIEWAKGEAYRRNGSRFVTIRLHDDGALELQSERMASARVKDPRALLAVIALAFDALPADEPRKLTRQLVGDLRDAATGRKSAERSERLERAADALESFIAGKPDRGT